MNDWNNNGRYDVTDQFIDFSVFEYSSSGGTSGDSNKRPEVAPEDAVGTLSGSILILIIIGIAFLLCSACGKNNELIKAAIMLGSVAICTPIFKKIQIKNK